MKDWVSPVYVFFYPKPCIVVISGQCTHKFKCCAKGCQSTTQRFLNKKNIRSTGNMHKHVRVCWGEDVLAAADHAKDANEAHTKIVGGILCNGSITASLEHKEKGKVTYSHHQHTRAETRYFVMQDKGFQSLMKTGRLEYYIPLPATEYPGKLNFIIDGWTATNHQAFVAVSAHLEHNGKTLSLPLDIIKVPNV
ncbi:hypothetical protein BDR06DRAFT_983824 [Suillus hirtellus]|nr:hypothetical protein BDR06DRAFT_983824 [Suillus hirtellus]